MDYLNTCMLDPISAIAAATAAYKSIQSLVSHGQDLERCVGQLSKWYSAASDIRKAQSYNNNPPLYKRFLASGSVEAEALQLIIHEKKLQEQEKELAALLNYRFGYGTWKEMIDLRREIKKKRDKEVYRIQELKRSILEGVFIVALLLMLSALLIGIIWFIYSYKY